MSLPEAIIYENVSGRGHKHWKRINNNNKLIPVELIEGEWRQVGLAVAEYDSSIFLEIDPACSSS